MISTGFTGGPVQGLGLMSGRGLYVSGRPAGSNHAHILRRLAALIFAVFAC